MSAPKSDKDYNHKTEFKFWEENKKFERQNNLMSQPPLDLNPFGKNMTNSKMSHLDLTPVGTKNSDTNPLTQLTKSSKCKEKAVKWYVPEDPESDPSSSDLSLSKSDSSDDIKYRKFRSKRNLIFPMTANAANLEARDTIKIGRVRNAKNRNRQTHC